jgi:hypothetical protein
VTLHFGDAHPLKEVSPAANDTRGHAPADQVLDAEVGHIEVRGVDARVIPFPRKASFVSAAGVESRHIGVEAGDDLNHGEAFSGAVGGELLEVSGPLESLAEAHPPGIGEPEERGTVSVLEVTPV